LNNDDDLRSIWFVTGSQHLYGEQTLRQVDEHARTIARRKCRYFGDERRP